MTGLGDRRILLALATAAGGTGEHVRSLAKGLVQRGAAVTIAGPAPTAERFGFATTGARFVPIDIIDRPRPGRDGRTMARLRKLAAGADVVHAHGLRIGGLTVIALAGRRGGRRPPVVVTVHNAVPAGPTAGVIYAALERVVARGATLVLAVSPDLMERAARRGAKNVELGVVPAAPPMAWNADPARARRDLGVTGEPLVVAVGRLAEQKGFATLLDAAATWASRPIPPLVLIAGEGPLESSLRSRIEAENLPVRLLGFRRDVPDLLAAADVLVLPSGWEGQPLILQEMLRAGRPIVATRVGGVPNLVGDAGILVPAGDAIALGRAVETVLDDADLAQRLARSAADRAVHLPTEDDAVDQMEAIYLRLLR